MAHLRQPPPAYSAFPECEPAKTPNPLCDDTPCDVLPEYECSVTITGELMMKPEKVSLATIAPRRRWKRVIAEIRGTMLMVHYRVRRRPFENQHIAKQTKIYTLQAAEAGIAIDYPKKRVNVLRVRVEAEQFLFAAPSPAICLEWVEKLNAAAAISLSLDHREEPKYRTLPRVGSQVPPLDIVAGVGHIADGIPSEGQAFPVRQISGFSDVSFANETSPYERQSEYLPWLSARQTQPAAKAKVPLAQSRSRINRLWFATGGEPLNDIGQTRSHTSSLSSPETVSLDPTAVFRSTKTSPAEKALSTSQNDMTAAAQIKWTWRCAPVLEYASKRTHKYVVHGGEILGVTRQGQLRSSSASVACLR